MKKKLWIRRFGIRENMSRAIYLQFKRRLQLITQISEVTIPEFPRFMSKLFLQEIYAVAAEYEIMLRKL